MTRCLALATVALAASAAAQQHVSVVPHDTAATPWATALAERLCQQVDCIEPALVLTKKKPDWMKAAKAGVDFVITVDTSKQKNSTVLTVGVHKADGEQQASKVLMTTSSTWSVKNLDAVLTTVWRTTGITPRPLPGAEVQPEKTPEKPAEPVKPEPSAPAVTSATPSGTQPATPSTTVAASPDAPTSTGGNAQPFFYVEAGAAGENRSFEYAGFRSRNLRAYSMPYFTSVAVAAELSPFLHSDGPLKGASLEAAVVFAPWLLTQVSPTQTVATFRTRVDAGLLYRLPLGGIPLTVLARVAFHTQQFTVSEPQAGLPNANYVGVRAGLGAELRFAERFTGFVQASALPMFISRDLVSAAYFGRGANVGLEVRGGLVTHLAGPLSVRASVEWTRYFFVLDANLVQDTFAQGAVDQYLGLHLTARLAFD